MINKYLKKILPTTNHQLLVTGFTLIELLVVISIIGILISAVTARYQTSEKQARDVKRKSDLSQYRTALENYAASGDSLYPTPATDPCVSASESLCTGSFKNSFIPACPEDQRYETNGRYLYCGTTEKYTLSTRLETNSLIWQICSNGQVCLTSYNVYQSTADCLCGLSSEPEASPTPE